MMSLPVMNATAAAIAVCVAATSSRVGAQPRQPRRSSPTVVSFRLSNGLRVHVEEDHRLPLVAMSMAFAAGGMREAPGRYGFAHLFEHMMFTATAHVDKKQHDTLFESIGAVDEGTTRLDVVDYYSIAPSAEIETVLWVESDRMGYLIPALTEERLQGVKETVVNEIDQIDGTPYGRADRRLLELAFPAPHPYFGNAIGRPDDVRTASLDDAARFFKSYYVPANAVLVIVGDADPAALRPLLEKYFGDLPSGRKPRLPPQAPVSLARSRSVRESMHDAVSSRRITVAWRVPGAFAPGGEDVTFDVLALLLADRQFGLLARRFIDDRRLLTDAECEHGRFLLGGLFHCNLTLRDGVDLSRVEAAFDELVAEVAHAPPAEEVEAARVSWRAGHLREQESIMERARTLAWYAALAGDPARLHADVAAHAEVTPAAIGRAATTYLLGGRRYMVVVEPRRDP